MDEQQQRRADRAGDVEGHGPLAGFTVGVTAAHGADELGALLAGQGAAVLYAPALRSVPPADDADPLAEVLDRLLDAVVARGLDAVTFTSASAAAAFLARGRQRDLLPALLSALADDVLPACADPATALPLWERGVDVVVPDRFRLGPLVQMLCRELPGRARALPVAGHRVEIRGQAVLVDGRLRPVTPAGMSLLRTLARRPGRVVARADLLRGMPGPGRHEHAVETAMARLRTALGTPKLIQTVVKRGYRLALDPTADPA